MGGPGIAKGRVVDRPVSTLDVVATFLEYGGVSNASLPHTAASLTPLLQASLDEKGYTRSAVHSGLSTGATALFDANLIDLETERGHSVDWRAVVFYFNSTCTLKVVCCPSGCPTGNSWAPAVESG